MSRVNLKSLAGNPLWYNVVRLRTREFLIVNTDR